MIKVFLIKKYYLSKLIYYCSHFNIKKDRLMSNKKKHSIDNRFAIKLVKRYLIISLLYYINESNISCNNS